MGFLEWAEEILEYGKEYWMIVLVAGLFILIFVLSARLVSLSKKERQESSSPPEKEHTDEKQTEEENTEEEFPVEPEKQEVTAEQNARQDVQQDEESEQTSPADDAYALLGLLKSINETISEERNGEKENGKPVEEKEADTATEPEQVTEPDTPAASAARGLVEQIIQGAEKAAGAADREVTSIDLEIEKARLIIRYGDKRVETFQKPELPEQTEEAEEVFCKETAGKTDFAQKEKEPPKKFGQDNTSTSRSGRVYTEEELRDQIKE